MTEEIEFDPPMVPPRIRWWCKVGFHRARKVRVYSDASQTSAGIDQGYRNICRDCKRNVEGWL